MRTKQIVVASMAVVMMFVAVGCSSSKPHVNAESSSNLAKDATQTPAKSVDLPAGWPSELAMPSGTTVTEATKIGDDGSLMVVATNDGDAQGVFDAFKSQLSGAGYQIVGSAFTASDKGGYGSISAKGDKYTVAIGFGPNDTGKINQTTINIAPVEP